MNDIAYRLATKSDLPAIQSLLVDCRLPIDGIEQLTDHCLLAWVNAQLVATIALEPYGSSALLRSLAVASACRGRSLGRTLCAKMISHARLVGVERLYLLTTNAEGYFTKLNFERVARGKVPAEIQATTQFRSLCPASAICMERDICGEIIYASGDLLPLRPVVPGASMWAVALRDTMLTYFEVAAHSRFETHSHVSEQITMVLSGELFFQVNATVHRVRAGEVIALPASVPHAAWTEALPVKAVDAWSPVRKEYLSAQL